MKLDNKYTYAKNMIPIRKFIIIFTLLLSSLGASSLYAQVVGDYQSRAAGLWSEASTWEVCTSISPLTWAPAGVAPYFSTTPALITILHNVTVNVSVWEDLNNLTISAGVLSFSTKASLRSRGILSNVDGTTCPNCLAGTNQLHQIANGDYRSSNSGNWGTATNWQKRVAGAWVVAPEAPGALAPSTSKVFLRTSTQMNLDVSPNNELNRLVIESGGTFATPTCNALLAKTVNTYGNYAPTVGKLITLNAGDIRSTGAAAWGVAGNWQEYNGTTWGGAPAEYPGEMPSAAQRDRDVIVLHTMTLGAAITNPSGNIYVASGCGITAASLLDLTVTTLKNCGTINSMVNIVYGINRYESISSGDWSDISVWRASTDGGTTWFVATQYPGEIAPSATQLVTIMSGHTVTLDISPFEDVNQLTVSGAMNVSNNSTVRYRSMTCTGCPATPTKRVFDGDYRSKATGSWGAATTWQKRVAGAWIDAPEYPGVLAAGTAQVFTRASHTISLNLTPAEEIHTLIVESGSTFAANTCNHLRLLATPSLNGIYNATLGKYIIINNGDFRSLAAGSWNVNTTWQQFTAGAWAATGTFPGATGTAGTEDVIIRHAVTLNTTPIEDIQELLIETGSSLSISGLFNLRYRGAYTNCGTYTAGSGGIHKVNNNDFRNILAGGTWSTSGTWERYNGTNWVAATIFPGQNASVGETVFVRNNVTTTVTATPPNSISGLVLENHATTTLTINTGITLVATGTVALYGTLNTVTTGFLDYANIGDYRTGTSAKNGDWRTATTGNWNDANKWERFNGSTWLGQGTAFPGQSVAAGQTIFIDHTTALNITPANSIGGLIVNNGITLTVNTSQILTVNGIYGRIGTGTVTLLGTLNATSNWSNIGVWEKFSNTGWGNASDYPGQNFSTTPPRVVIRAGYSVSTDLSPLHDIQTLAIVGGTVNGTLTFTGTLGTNGSTIRARVATDLIGIMPNIGTCTACPTRVLVIANGDYRSKATGNWETAATWEKFVSNAWIDAPEAPGAIDPTANTSRVFIRNTHTVTLGQTPFNDVGQVFVERGGTYTINAAGPHSLRARTAISVNGTYTPNGGSYFLLANNDYRSIASTDWSTPATWERYNGTTWVNPATVYPGQNVASYGSVYIRRGHTVEHDLSPPEDINAFTIENGGVLKQTNCRNLTLRGNFSILGSITSTPAFPDSQVADRFIRVQNLDYRSNVATGNWSAAASWQKFVAGAWSGAPEAPGVIAPVLGQNVIIRNGHNITLDANPTNRLVDIYVLSGGTLTDGGATLVNINGRNVTDPGQQCGTLSSGTFPAFAAEFVYVGDAYYRSRQTGNWSDFNTWEVTNNPDSTSGYMAATLDNYPGTRVPPGAASTVFIAAGHTVTVDVSPAQHLRRLSVLSGGILTFTTATSSRNIKVRTPVSNAGTINNLHSNTIPNITITGTMPTPVPNTGTFTQIANGTYRTSGSGNWSSVNTWHIFSGGQWIRPAVVPGNTVGTSPVIISSGHTINADISMTGTNLIAHLVIENGATFNAATGSNIRISQHFINHGTFLPTAGAITFVGSSPSNIAGGANPVNYIFNDLIINSDKSALVSTSKSFGIRNSFVNNSTTMSNVFLASSPSEIIFKSGGTESISGVANSTGTFPATTFQNPVSFFKLTLDSTTTVSVSTPITVTNELFHKRSSRLINTSEVVITNLLSSDNAANSEFANATNGYLRYRSTQVPFNVPVATNALDATSAANNMVEYDLMNGAQTIYPSSYHTLRMTNGGTKTMNVGTTKYEVTSLLSISKGTGTATNVIINGTTGRLLNFAANVGLGCTYTYNANDRNDTNAMGELPNLNGQGLSANDHASNFSGRFNIISVADATGNGISSSNLNDIKFDRGGTGTMRAVRNVNIPDVPGAAVVRFDVVGAVNSSVATDVAFMAIGNNLPNDDNNSTNVAARISFGFNDKNEINLVHQGGSNNNVGGSFVPNTNTGRRRIAWFINRSGATITYTNPSGGTSTLANGRVDIWLNNNREVAGVAMLSSAHALTSLKIVCQNGTGGFTLENIKINPIAQLNISNYTQTMLSGSASPLCVSSLPFTINTGAPKADANYTTLPNPGSIYNPDNQFLVQLSMPNGSFNQFTEIGRTSPSSSLTGTVPLIIPANILPSMASGTNFRIRVVSTDPPMISEPSTNNLNILFYRIVRNSDNSVPNLQAITTTAPNQLTEMLRADPAGTSYGWKVRYKSPGPSFDNVTPTAIATTMTFQANGTNATHFPWGPGLYDLFCEVVTPSCGLVITSSVRIVLECTGCIKNPRPYDPCVKNLVFNGTFEAGTWGGVRWSSDASLDNPVFPATMPDINSLDSEGMIPFETTGNPYGGATPDIRFSPYSDVSTFGNLASPNGEQIRRQKTRNYTVNSQTFTLRLNTPYGFSTEYGGTEFATRQSNMSLETDANSRKGGGTMAPENQWAVTSNPRFYMGDVCDADGTDYDPGRVPAGGDGLWGSGARGTTWNYTQVPPNSPTGTTGTGTALTLNPHGRGGPPFTQFPFQVTSYGGGNNPTYASAISYPRNSSPSGGRMQIANGDYGTAAKMWTQRFKVRKNTDYIFSFWAVNLNSISAIYGVFADCAQLGNNLFLEGDATRCVWQQYTFLWNSGELGTVEFSIRNISTVRSGNDLGIDDIMFYRCDGNTNLFPTTNKFVWKGFNTDWFNPDNWGNCVLPTCDSDVTIPAESTNPATSGTNTYYMPIIQASANTVPAYAGGHPAYTEPNRNINTRNLAKVRTITIEHGARLRIGTDSTSKPWNLDICGSLIAKKNLIPATTINWLNPPTPGTSYNSSITFTSTAAQANAPLVPAVISGDFTFAGSSNELPTLIVRKQSGTMMNSDNAKDQVVRLDDNIDVYGNLVIVDGTLDANGKNIIFKGSNFVNGARSADTGNNPTNIGNAFFAYLPAAAVAETTGPNTTSGAGFIHNGGTVTFQSNAAGDQSYYKREKTLCPSCPESFYNLIIDQTAVTTNRLDIVRGDLIITNNLHLKSGYIIASKSTGAREVYITNPDATAGLTGGSETSYVVTTNDSYTPTEVNLKLRREINGLDFATKDYKFPVGGNGSGNPAGTVLTGYRELIFRQTTAISFVSSVRAYFDARNSSAAYSMAKLPAAVSDAYCPRPNGENLTYTLCTGGYWDLKPLNNLGGIESPTGISYNLTMPSIPAAFTCSGTPTRTTFVKRTNEADNWGFGASCWVNPQTRTGFNTFTKYAPVSTITLLPVEFLSFDAFKNNQTVDVKWETISERNSSHFIVQRSADGKNFIPVGRVEANGNTTSAVKYLFTDTKPMQGINYYRLLQVDLDGKETLTKVVSITFNGDDADLQVFPNPSSEGVAFNVILPASVAGSEVEMRMTDAVGRQMLYQRFRFEGGTIQLPADFAKGLYTLTIATPKENYVRKLIIK